VDICSRTTVARFPVISVFRRIQKAVSLHPQTLGEHLRLARVDRNLTNVQVAQMLGVAYQTVERWEHNRNPISPMLRLKIVAFIGYDPEATPGGSNR
jgi:DNA-binding transcriptional regulator YiaG